VELTGEQQRFESHLTDILLSAYPPEALAFGSLMLEGYDVRISGQDVGRGTFSHRCVFPTIALRTAYSYPLESHAMLIDQKTEEVIVPLNEFLKGGRIELANSEFLAQIIQFNADGDIGSLSEVAVLGVCIALTIFSQISLRPMTVRIRNELGDTESAPNMGSTVR
jgi:Transketolase, pyrimidine binding domain